MSTDLAESVARWSTEDALLPLTALDEGSFSGLMPLPASAFASCRLPQESRAGWLLFAGFGTKSHAVSQDLKTREASYWHAIYHRLEPDAWNAQYWFRQVGRHPIEQQLLQQSRDAGWDPGQNWDHSRFVDYIDAARASSHAQQRTLAARIQTLEWRLLFEYCQKDLSE
ncbi:MAG: hypothetical protein FJW36_13205 [Acidobacteria bacterium]|nr:hypothetical protein [Acidobacteriota bacterium]